ncbi:MAG: YfbK domain-containing protein [Devosia sp.]
MSDDMNEDPLAALTRTTLPPPSAQARQRAIEAGLATFAAQQQKAETTAKGLGWGARLRTIITSLKGISIMDLRLPIGTAAIVLLVLPLGYQLYNSTMLTPDETLPPRPVMANQPAAEIANNTAPSGQVVASPDKAVAAPEPETAGADAASVMTEDTMAATGLAAPSTSMQSMVQTGAQMRQEAVAMPAPAPLAKTGGAIAGSMTVPSGDTFTRFDEQRLKTVAEDPVSTFSIDVDSASYAYVRRMLEDGLLPAPDAVRVEEMINYFPFDYAPAHSAATPFEPSMAVYPTPWNPRTQLLQIGIKGYVPPAGEDKPSNLVFLIDTSGSMEADDKLPLLKRAFALLVDQLSDNDTVSIVAYAGSAGVVLEPTVATQRARILSALDNLSAGGSTAGAEGIELAYRLAEQAKVAGGTNRVILATDGDFNVGIDDPEDLEAYIKAKRDSGVTLSVLGFGRGNLDDATMQALAQNGNGNAAYISNFREAQKVLVEEMGGTLDMIAKDVKIQVEFNPAIVSEYRLIGYETRALNREDFNNDAVDAGDVGAGTTVTALYEITPAGSGRELVDPLRYGAQAGTEPAAVATMNAPGEIAFLKMRYKLPDRDVSQLIEAPVTPALVYGDIADVSDDMRFAAAVAAFGQKLRGSVYTTGIGWSAIEELARAGKGSDKNGYRAEFINLVRTASLLKPDSDSDPCDVAVSAEGCD